MGFSADASRIALPRGKVFFARKNNLSTGTLDPLLHLGNCSKFEFSSIGDDIAKITDFTTFVSTPLAQISKLRAPEFGLTLMECNPDNLKLVFMADSGTAYTQSAGTVPGELLSGGIKVGAIYKLAKRGIPGGTQITALTLKKGGVALSVATDYSLIDATNGIVVINAITSSSVAAGDAITADYTAPAITTGLNVLTGGTASRIEGQLLYIGTSNIGPVHQVDIWNCAISSDGAFPFISSDPNEFGLKVTVLSSSQTDLFRITELEAS